MHQCMANFCYDICIYDYQSYSDSNAKFVCMECLNPCDTCVGVLNTTAIELNFPNIMSLDIGGCEYVRGEQRFELTGCNYISG